jgi:long-chain acyl-CoA synthetase
MDAEAAANAYAELVQEGGEFEVGSVRIGSRVVPAFLRAPPTLPQYFARGFVEHRDAIFIVYENERLTFGEFERRAALLAHELMVVHDVRPGDRCAVSMRNMPEWAIAFCAASAIGAVVVPLNSWWQMKEMEYGLSDSGAKVLVCDAERHRRAAPSLRKLGIAAIVARATAAEAVDIRAAGDVLFDDALRRSFMAGCEQAAAGGGTIQLPSVEVGPDTAAVIMYTSGTTGLPKGVVQSHRGVCDQMHMVALGARLAERVARALGTTPPPHVPRQECIICPVPLFHVTGSHHIFLQCFVSGRKLCLMPKWDAGKALALIEAERATVWTGVPTMVQDMMAHRDFASRDTSSLKIIGGGGAPSPPSKVEGVDVAFRKQRGSGRASQGYGLTVRFEELRSGGGV